STVTMCPILMALEGCPAPAAAVISSEILSSSIAWAWTAASNDITAILSHPGAGAGDIVARTDPDPRGETPTGGWVSIGDSSALGNLPDPQPYPRPPMRYTSLRKKRSSS